MGKHGQITKEEYKRIVCPCKGKIRKGKAQNQLYIAKDTCNWNSFSIWFTAKSVITLNALKATSSPKSSVGSTYGHTYDTTLC